MSGETISLTSLVFVVGFACLLLWAVSIVVLMDRRDDEFPGRFDKPIWAAIILLVPILGSIVFLIWKRNGLIRNAPPGQWSR